jgi:hypothetical protein
MSNTTLRKNQKNQLNNTGINQQKLQQETNSSQNVMTMAHALIIGLIGKQAKLNYLIF